MQRGARRRSSAGSCAHELTHVFQFQGVPWLREHLASLLRSYLESVEVRIDRGAAGGLPSLPEPGRLVETFREGGLVALIQTREQRARDGPPPGGDGRDRGLLRARDGRARRAADPGAPSAARGDGPPPPRALGARARGGAAARPRPEARASTSVGKAFSDAVVAEGGIEALNLVWSAPEALPDHCGGAERSGRLAARVRPGSGASLTVPALRRQPSVVSGRRYGRVLQTCVRWYSSTDLRTNKRSEPRRAGEGESQMATQTEHTAKGHRPEGRRHPPSQRRQAQPVAPARPPRPRAQAELSTVAAVQAQAERAVLIPVGAALVARDAVVEAAKPYTRAVTAPRRSSTSSRSASSTNLRKFERRGTTARNRPSARSSAPARASSASCASAAPRPSGR